MINRSMISNLKQSIENLRRGVTGPPRKSRTDPHTPRPMNQGGTADVFEEGENDVLKLFHNSIPSERVDDEYEATKFAYESGLPVPRPGEKVDVDGRRGITFERVGGEPLWNLLFRRPWILARRSQADLFARLHGQIHDVRAPPEMKSTHDYMANSISQATTVSPKLCREAESRLQGLKGGDTLCHGDYQFGNVLIGVRPTVIDWHDASRGHLVSDIAMSTTFMTLLCDVLNTSAPPVARNLLAAVVRRFHRQYLDAYCHERGPIDPHELRRWTFVCGLVWISRFELTLAGIVGPAQAVGLIRRSNQYIHDHFERGTYD